MSSIIGHSLAAITIFKCADERNNKNDKYVWLSWLIICALFPDLDYIFVALQSINHNGIRITHSIVIALVLPFISICFLMLKVGRKDIKVKSVQLILAGLSHLMLDLMVGVTPIAILWPLSNKIIKMPFGVLPSAGKISIWNYYFYRNLIIEIGILMPICFMLFYIFNGYKPKIGKLKIITLLIVFISSLIWSMSLAR
jgi:inner membrane protein